MPELPTRRRQGGKRGGKRLTFGLPFFDRLVTKGDQYSFAVFSPCDRYRYVLARLWDNYFPEVEEYLYESQRPVLVVCGKNPSTATHEESDPTLRKLCHYAKRDGFGGLLLVNAFALRTTDPMKVVAAIQRREDAVGPENDNAIRWAKEAPVMAKCAAAWGKPERACMRRRLVEVKNHGLVGRRWYAYGATKDGYPRHVLYLRNCAPLLTLDQHIDLVRTA